MALSTSANFIKYLLFLFNFFFAVSWDTTKPHQPNDQFNFAFFLTLLSLSLSYLDHGCDHNGGWLNRARRLSQLPRHSRRKVLQHSHLSGGDWIVHLCDCLFRVLRRLQGKLLHDPNGKSRHLRSDANCLLPLLPVCNRFFFFAHPVLVVICSFPSCWSWSLYWNWRPVSVGTCCAMTPANSWAMHWTHRWRAMAARTLVTLRWFGTRFRLMWVSE